MRYLSALTVAVLPLSTVLGLGLLSSAQAHRSGCHRWHSCESDRGTYVCGDLGYDTYCDTRTSSVRTVPAMVPVAQNRIAVLKDGPVKFRLKPSTQAQVLSKLEKGTKVNLGACGANWCAVRYLGVRGYMMKKYLSL